MQLGKQFSMTYHLVPEQHVYKYSYKTCYVNRGGCARSHPSCHEESAAVGSGQTHCSLHAARQGADLAACERRRGYWHTIQTPKSGTHLFSRKRLSTTVFIFKFICSLLRFVLQVFASLTKLNKWQITLLFTINVAIQVLGRVYNITS